MNQKGFANIIVLGIVIVILVGVAGYFVVVRKPITPTHTQQPITNNETITPTPSGTKSVTKIPSSPTKLNVSGAPSEPTDQALVEITVLSQTENGWKIRVDKIRDYIRYPLTTNPQLKTGDAVSIRFNGWLDTFQSNDLVCPAGYIKSPKPGGTVPVGTPDTRTVPTITISEKYLAKLSGCFEAETGGFSCGPLGTGWSGWFYNPFQIVIEYVCIKPEPNTIPPAPIKPQR